MWSSAHINGKRRRQWQLLALLILIPSHAAGEAPRIDRVVIFERGIYRAQSTGMPHPAVSMRPVSGVQNSQLIDSTTTVPARHLTRFGLRYVVNGAPHGAVVGLRMITRYPDGGLLDPVSRQRHFQHEYNIDVQIGVPGYRDYNLDEDWEVVPGRWVFEFWIGIRKLGEQQFCLFEPTSPKAVMDCMKLISFLATPASSNQKAIQ